MHATLVFAALVAPFIGLASAKPEKIRGVSNPIYHLYLQTYPKNSSLIVLGPEATAESFNIGKTIQSTNTSMFLNIGSDTTSYKTITLDKTSNTDAWGLEGDTIITTNGSKFGRQLNWLVCKLEGNYYQPYLQTGSGTPAGKTCSNYLTLHLPCLC